jgi:hypothetical protein
MLRPFFATIAIFFLGNLIAGQALAACPNRPDADTLEVEGIGLIQASSIGSDDNGQVLRNACLEYRNWTLTGPEFFVANDVLRAETVTLEAPGSKGTVARLQSTASGAINFKVLHLELAPGFQLEGFPFAGRYVVDAEAGVLDGSRFDLSGAIFDEFSASGQPARRIKAKRALLGDNTATLFEASVAQAQFTIRGALIVQANQQIGATRSDSTLGRNRDSTEITVQSDRAITDEEGIIHLENATVSLFGLALPTFPDLEYDPSDGNPVVFGVGPGLTLGLQNVRIGKKRDGVRVGLVAHDLFTPKPTVSFGITWVQPDFSLSLAQAKNDSLQAVFSSSAATGWLYGISINAGRNVLDFGTPLGEGGFQKAQVGYAFEQKFTLPKEPGDPTNNNFKLREVAEIGEVWQEEGAGATLTKPHTQSQFVVYGAASLGASYDGNALDARGFGFSWDVITSINAIEYTPSLGNASRPDPTFTSAAAIGLAARYTSEFFSVGVAFNHRQPVANTYADTYTPGVNTRFIRRLALEDYTIVVLSARLGGSLGTPEAGYGGLTIENPYLTFGLVVDVRNLDKTSNEYFQLYKIGAGFDINIYDGRPFIDNFDRALALPVVTLSPFARYDFAFAPGYQVGQYGADITLYTASLGFTFSLSYETRLKANGTFADGGGFGFGFGFKLR